MENKKVTLNNGTELEVGGLYHNYVSTILHAKCLAIYDEFCWMEIERTDGVIVVKTQPIHDRWLPYTPPTPQKEWKTFLIETLSQKTDIPYRFFSLYYSVEDAREHHKRAISIQEVKLNIEPVNS